MRFAASIAAACLICMLTSDLFQGRGIWDGPAFGKPVNQQADSTD
jgi:hypothetical protein